MLDDTDLSISSSYAIHMFKNLLSGKVKKMVVFFIKW